MSKLPKSFQNPKPVRDSGIIDTSYSERTAERTEKTAFAVGSPVTERNGIITNQPATFVKPGPTSTERYSKVTDDGGEYDPGSTLSLGRLAGLSKPKHLNPSSTLGFLDATSTTKSSKIPDEIIAEAQTLVSKIVEINPDALGIALVVHNERVHEVIPNLEHLDGIENGTSQLKNGFANNGLAVVRLENPSKQLLEAVIQTISSNESPVKFTLSYRYFFFYTTGHGADRVFFTYDGSISYYDVIESFTNTQRFVQKYFFFDCCRFSGLDRRSEYPNGDRILPFVPQIITHPENRIIFATTGGATAWGPGEGPRVSYMTKTMVELLPQPITLDELIRCLQSEVHLTVKKGDPSKDQHPTSRDATSNTINLSEERNQKMQPSISQLVFEDGANISVQLKKPLALNNEDSIYEMCKVQYRHIGEADWKEQQPTVHGTSIPLELPATVDLSLSLPTDGHDGCQQVEFRVVAYYKGGLVVPSKPIHTVLPGLVRPLINQPTFQDGGYVANFAVQLKKPLAVNNDNSSCHTCMLEYRRTNGSDVEWKTLEQRPTDGAISLTALELPTTVGLSVFLPTDEHTDNQQVEFRVLAHYNGGLDVPSETIRTDLPYLVQPVVTAVEVKGVCHSKLQVSWYQPFQQELGIRQYNVTITSVATDTVLAAADFDVDNGKVDCCELIRVPLLYKHGEVHVKVIARNDRLDISSHDFYKSCTTEIFIRRAMACTPFTVLFLLVLVIFVVTIALNGNAYTGSSTQATMFVTDTVGVIALGIQSGFNNFAFSFTGFDVRLCDSDKPDPPPVVYCATYNSSQLNTNRRVKYLSRDDTFIRLNRTYTPGRYSLPISSPVPLYLLEGSEIFVKVCPSSSNPACNNSFYKIDFFVFNDQEIRDDFVYENSSPSALTSEIKFGDGDPCQNHSILVNQSTLAYFALSTDDVICLKELSGSITKRFYSVEGLDLNTEKNKLIDGELFVKGDASSRLVCVAPNSEGVDNLCVNNRLVFNGIFLACALPLFCIIMICCVTHCCVICKICCRKSETSRYGYVALIT